MFDYEILTVNQVSEWLKISPSELRKLMANKEIAYFEVGELDSKRKAKRFRYLDVITYINKNLVKEDSYAI